MENTEQRLKHQQKLTFSILFLGYVVYVLDRKSFTFVIPTVKQAENIEAESIGSIVSSLALGYAIGKFFCGILVDSVSPKYLFSAGLVICGGINIAFSVSSSISAYAFLWFVNGLFQGLGWPPCAKLLKSWYSPNVFGTLWSLLSASMNVAASIGPFICNGIIDYSGSWRYTMQAFGMISILVATLVLLFVHDEPKHAGFSSNNIEEISKNEDVRTDKDVKGSKSKSETSFLSAMKRIFSSPYLYVTSFGFLIILVCRGVFSTWTTLYLISEKGATKTMASTFAGVMEIGGICGSVSAGLITDQICVLMAHQTKGNPRNYFFIPCSIVLAISIILLRSSISDISSQFSYALLLAFMIGFCIYSMFSMVGVMTIERSANDISGRSHAVGSLFGNVGLTLSGLPFSMVVEKYSWSTAFFVLECGIYLLATVTIISQSIECRIGFSKHKVE